MQPKIITKKRKCGRASPGRVLLCGHGLDHVDLRYAPFEEVVGALALHPADLRQVGRVGQHGVEELRDGVVGGIDLAGEALVEGFLLVAGQPGRQDALRDEVVVGVDVAHVVGVGVEFVHDGRDDNHLHRVVHTRHLDEGRVDGVRPLEIVGHAVREEYELGIGQVVEVDHLSVVAEGFAHGLALFLVPLAALRTPEEPCGEEGQQGQTEKQFFHVVAN